MLSPRHSSSNASFINIACNRMPTTMIDKINTLSCIPRRERRSGAPTGGHNGNPQLWITRNASPALS
eukprot:9403548-Alexandrium_andersonii.AAC.1